MSPQELRARLITLIIDPLIALLFAAALLVFAWGIVEFVWGISSGEGESGQGKQHMLWGIIGLVVMSGAYAIIQIIVHTLGTSLPN